MPAKVPALLGLFLSHPTKRPQRHIHPMPYQLSISTAFSAASSTPHMNDACGRLHGYSYKVDAVLHCEQLPSTGNMGDGYAWQAMLNDVIAPLKHQHLNELPAFRIRPPTMEHLAEWIFVAFQQQLHQHNAPASLASITLDNQMGLALTYTGPTP